VDFPNNDELKKRANAPLYGRFLSNQESEKYGLPYSIVDYGGYNKIPSISQLGDVTLVDPFVGQKDVTRDRSFNRNIKDVLGGNLRSNLPDYVLEKIYGISGGNVNAPMSPSKALIRKIRRDFINTDTPVVKTPPLDSYYKTSQ
jgi:hypothetical protein